MYGMWDTRAHPLLETPLLKYSWDSWLSIEPKLQWFEWKVVFCFVFLKNHKVPIWSLQLQGQENCIAQFINTFNYAIYQ